MTVTSRARTDSRPGPETSAHPATREDHPAAPRQRTVRVSAILVVCNGAAWLTECLDAIAAQHRPPERLLIVDVASTDTSAAIAQAHQAVRRVVGDVSIRRLDEVVPIGRAIDAGIASLPDADPGEWVWVVHDDTRPHPSALGHLVEAVRRSPSVGVAGPKLVEWDDRRRLVELGVQVTRAGRRIASPARGEADQGQHDGRTDVLAVSTSGMLLRRDVHAQLEGFDPSFQQYGADLDLGWRAQLAGHRVVVVPAAVVRDACATADGRRPGAARPREVERRGRVAARKVALARCSPWLAPFLVTWMAVSAVLAGLTLLIAKRPRKAWRELTDVAVVLYPRAVSSARWRGHRTKRLRRRDLATLFVSPGAAARTTLDHIQDAITPERRRRPREVVLAAEPGPTADDSQSLHVLPASLPRRIVTHPGFLAVLLTALATVVAWRDAIRAGALSVSHTGLAGGELRPVTADASGLWHAFRDAWHGAGLGTGAESGPYLAILAALTWLVEQVPGVAESRSPAAVAVAWLLFLGPALSTWVAYVAGRVVTPSRGARAVAATAWGVSTTLTGAVSDGRVTAVLAHLVLPFVLAGFVLAARRDGTFTAAFATALAAAILGAVAPPLLVVALLAAAIMVVVGPGARRARALVLLVVPVGLLGPWVLRFVEDWRLALAGPGLISTDAPAEAWLPVLGHPVAVDGPGLWLLAPIVLLGLLGYAVRARGRAQTLGLWLGILLSVVGLAIAVGAPRVMLGSSETSVGVSAPAHLWAGVGIDLWLAGVLAGLLSGGDVVRRRLGRPYRPWRVAGATAVAGLATLSVLAVSVGWAVSGLGGTLSVGRASLPAVAVDQARGDLGNRLLLLRPTEAVVDFRLIGVEPGEPLRDLDVPSEDGGADADLLGAIAALVGGRQGDADTAPATARLARHGVAYIQVEAPGGAETPLSRRLDASDGLSRLGAGDHGVLWRVQPLPAAAGAPAAAAPSRVRLVDASGGLIAPVPVTGPHAATDTPIPAGAEGRRVVFAEPGGWAQHALVTLDGRTLEPVTGEVQPTYALPAEGGQLRADLAAARPWWRAGQAALLAFVLFMAVPFGNRRSRRRA